VAGGGASGAYVGDWFYSQSEDTWSVSAQANVWGIGYVGAPFSYASAYAGLQLWRTRPIGGIVRGSVRLDRRIVGSGSTAAETAAGMASAGRAAAEATIERPDSADIFRRLSVRQEGDSPDSDPACRPRVAYQIDLGRDL
jgi:hypothetical protein